MLIDKYKIFCFEDDYGEESFYMFKIDCIFIILLKVMKRKVINIDILYLENFELINIKINLVV